jgi:hypothetical protein
MGNTQAAMPDTYAACDPESTGMFSVIYYTCDEDWWTQKDTLITLMGFRLKTQSHAHLNQDAFGSVIQARLATLA